MTASIAGKVISTNQYAANNGSLKKTTLADFTRNLQGNIIGVYRSSDSKLIGTYEYDLWGKLISAKEARALILMASLPRIPSATEAITTITR